ncbi:OmpA family protein [Rudaeicoccus suwonensis]|uniref:OmpA family protein n=1 Tax=Rudaeicoccus suwonensis TaxID=657409 RepID=A0A561E4D5_9MICO|nr:OmpA family protein [Rudaeicoccus suwonensis]TWE10440.1 OmpA family protein [Rudaeicoccus suwonensis]
MDSADTAAPDGAGSPDPDRDEPSTRRVRKPRWPALVLAVVVVPAVVAAAGGAVTRHSIQDTLHTQAVDALQKAGITGVSVRFDGRDAILTVADASDETRAADVVAGVQGVRSVTDATATAVPSPVSTSSASPTASCSGLNGKISALLSANKPSFGSGSTQLSSPSNPGLDQIATLMKGCPTTRFQVAGYTDNTGDASTNLTLSQQRAQTVVTYLVAHGVAAGNLTAKGFGQADPIADNGTSAGQAANRRIVITELTGSASASASPSPSSSSSASVSAACSNLNATISGDLSGNQPAFAVGSTQLAPGDNPTLDQIATTMKGCASDAFVVAAYTDNTGDPASNLALSQGRAQAVLNYLVNQGVPSGSLSAQGYGEADPIADNSTSAGQAANRRIVITVAGG